MRLPSLLVTIMCFILSGQASGQDPDLLISGTVLRGKCVLGACANKSYLVEVTHVSKKPQGLSDAKIAIISVCGRESLELGKAYSFALTIHDLSLTALEQNSQGNPDAQDAELMRLCQFAIQDAHPS